MNKSNQIGQFDTPEILKQPKTDRTVEVDTFVATAEGPQGEIILSEMRTQIASRYPEMTSRGVIEEIYASEETPALPLAQEREDPDEKSMRERKLVAEQLDKIRESGEAVHLRTEVPIAPHTKVILTQDTVNADRGEITKAVLKSHGLAGNTFGIKDFIDYLKSFVEKPDSSFGMETNEQRKRSRLAKRFLDIQTKDNVQYELGVTGQGTRAFG